MKKYGVVFLKFAISFAILGYLFYRATSTGEFGKLVESDKDWRLLLAATVVAFTAVGVSFFRWYLLVRALELPMHLIDAFRLGFIGFLFTFLTLGVIGGDAVKAIFVARLTPGHKAEAITTVFIDRIIGLFGLFLITSVAYFFMQVPETETDTGWEVIRLICLISIGLSASAIIALVILLLNPRLDETRLFHWLYGIPTLGSIFRRVVASIMCYRKRLDVLFISVGLSLVVHSLLTTSVYLVASGISENPLPLSDHFIMVPISNVAGAIPLPGGLGAFEAALDMLYVGMSNGTIAAGKGFVVAFCFRLITLLVAAVGIVLYISHKKQVNELLEEASHDEDLHIG